MHPLRSVLIANDPLTKAVRTYCSVFQHPTDWTSGFGLQKIPSL